MDLYNVICLEDISLRDISRSLHLGKSVMDACFGTFRQLLQYKTDRGPDISFMWRNGIFTPKPATAAGI